MLLDKLRQKLVPEEDFNVAAGVDYLSKHGVTDNELQKNFGITERTIYRYKAKMKESGTDTLSQGPTTNLAVSGSNKI